MTIEHVTEEGDCFSSIAFQYGFFTATLWNAGENSKLKELRKHSTVLEPGDRVIIPDKRPKRVSVACDARHTFVRKGVPALFTTRLLRGLKPRAHLAYVLQAEGRCYRGKSGADGVIRQYISPAARELTLLIAGENGEEQYQFLLGQALPVEDLRGVQTRLQNLGFYEGPIDGQANDVTAAAIRGFQRQYKLNPTGVADPATGDRLRVEFGG